MDDFDAANGAKSTEKTVEPGQDNANAEVWNEEFIAYVKYLSLVLWINSPWIRKKLYRVYLK